MRISGYCYTTRLDTIKGILARMVQIEELITDGTRQKYRDGKTIRDQKDNRLGKSTNTWFLKSGATSTLNVQCTPGASLKARVQKVMEKLRGPDNGLTKVIEESGISVMSGLKVSDPYQNMGCQYPEKCSADGQTDCSVSRCVYLIQCMKCKVILPNKKVLYTGTTGCTLHKRLTEHEKAVQRKQTDNALAKHMRLKHPGEAPQFSTSILDKQRYNLQRYVSESLYIEKYTLTENIEVMNSKTEWGRQKLTRIAIVDNT